MQLISQTFMTYTKLWLFLGDACGKPCKVPYLKGGFEVHGLPEGIPFKKPYSYGRIQLKQIMQHANNIHFTITPTPTSTSTSASVSTTASTSNSSLPTSTPPSASTSGSTSSQTSASTNNTDTAPSASSVETTPSSTADIQHVLTRISGTEAAKRVLDGGRIEEEEVEVVDLCLSASERLTLYASCTHLFTPDAWLSVGVNMKHSDEATSLVLPIYTTADEQFWLFHTISKPTRIVKSVNTTKIRGHWLDLRYDGCYTVLNNDQVLGKNIIRTAHGPLYFECCVNLDSAEPFCLPRDIRSVILVTLHQQGLCTVWKGLK